MTDENNASPQTGRQIATAVQGTGQGPEIIASGYGDLAKKILEAAYTAGVKVREDADLASMLAALDRCEHIPPHALYTVLEILEYVYFVEGRETPFDASSFGLGDDPSNNHARRPH